MTIKYSDFVDYSKLDPVKRMALELFEPTLAYPERLGIKVIPETLGQTSVGFDFSGIGDSDFILTGNIEGLGTKNRIADNMYSILITEKIKIAEGLNAPQLFEGVGQCAAATSINDQTPLGADVFSYYDIISSGDSSWFSQNEERTWYLLHGYRIVADNGKFAIPQGETPELRDVVNPDTLDIAGFSNGLIRPRSRLMTGIAIQIGDVVYGLESTGIHSNGLTKARRLAVKLPNGFFTYLGNGQTLGEALLVPTRIYSRPVISMLDAGVDIHYSQPITGHGWEKIARAKGQFNYVIERVPEPPLLFQKLIEWGAQNDFDVSDRENYFTWNMGIGYVVIAPEKDGEKIEKISNEFGIKTHKLGYVDNGERQVVMPFSDNGKRVVYTP